MTMVGDPDAAQSVWFVHGVLGQGRNWRSFARGVVDAHPGFRAVLPDLRNHGSHPKVSPPHTMAAAAADLAHLAAASGAPDVLVGHSLGGKVVLSWLERGDLPATTTVWVLDAPPGAGRARQPAGDLSADPVRVMEILRGAPTPAPSRDPVRTYLREQGMSEPIVQWLLTSVTRTDTGWDWVYDLDGIEQMLADYFALDFWPLVQSAGARVQLVRAGAGGRWSDDEVQRAVHAASTSQVGFHTLPAAGHWLHVDAPDAIRALLSRSFTR